MTEQTFISQVTARFDAQISQNLCDHHRSTRSQTERHPGNTHVQFISLHGLLRTEDRRQVQTTGSNRMFRLDSLSLFHLHHTGERDELRIPDIRTKTGIINDHNNLGLNCLFFQETYVVVVHVWTYFLPS